MDAWFDIFRTDSVASACKNRSQLFDCYENGKKKRDLKAIIRALKEKEHQGSIPGCSVSISLTQTLKIKLQLIFDRLRERRLSLFQT